MPRIVVIDREKRSIKIDADPDVSLMEAIRDYATDDLLALCGGFCSCATCHVYVDDEWLERVGPPGEDENELLDGSCHRLESSRLSCQIMIHDNLEGLTVRIAPED